MPEWRDLDHHERTTVGLGAPQRGDEGRVEPVGSRIGQHHDVGRLDPRRRIAGDAALRGVQVGVEVAVESVGTLGIAARRLQGQLATTSGGNRRWNRSERPIAAKAGPNLTTDAFVATIENFTAPRDMFGADAMSFTKTKHLGSNRARLSQIVNGKWTPITDYITD